MNNATSLIPKSAPALPSALRTPLLRPLISALLFAGVICAGLANADETSMRVDADAPLHVVLLPAVTVTAYAGDPHLPGLINVAAVEPLGITLLPTVHVTAVRPARVVAAAVDAHGAFGDDA